MSHHLLKILTYKFTVIAFIRWQCALEKCTKNEQEREANIVKSKNKHENVFWYFAAGAAGAQALLFSYFSFHSFFFFSSACVQHFHRISNCFLPMYFSIGIATTTNVTGFSSPSESSVSVDGLLSESCIPWWYLANYAVGAYTWKQCQRILLRRIESLKSDVVCRVHKTKRARAHTHIHTWKKDSAISNSQAA